MLRAIHHITVISRQVRQRIIAVPLPERFEEIIGKILAAGFVTILDHHLECLAVLRRDTLENLSDKIVEMRLDMRPAHLVGFIAGRLRAAQGCSSFR